MRRTLSFLLVLLTLAACGSSSLGGEPASGVTGRVLIGPQCPVEQVGSPCPDKPAVAEVQVFRVGAVGVLTSAHSDQDGRFRLELEPGSYELLPVVSESGGLPYGKRVLVEVDSGRYSRVALSLDSGIR